MTAALPVPDPKSEIRSRLRARYAAAIKSAIKVDALVAHAEKARDIREQRNALARSEEFAARFRSKSGFVIGSAQEQERWFASKGLVLEVEDHRAAGDWYAVEAEIAKEQLGRAKAAERARLQTEHLRIHASQPAFVNHDWSISDAVPGHPRCGPHFHPGVDVRGEILTAEVPDRESQRQRRLELLLEQAEAAKTEAAKA